MKLNLTPLLLSLSVQFAFSNPATELEAELIFPNGDTLPGLPGGLGSSGTLLWESPLFKNSQNSFNTSAIDTIHLSSERLRDRANTIASLTFQTRVDEIFDVMEGELLSLNDEEIMLRTWYAGDLRIKRKMLHSIKVDTEAPAILNGPGRITDWETIESGKAWRIEGKNLISSERGAISRELAELPDKIKLQFDYTFELSPYLQLYFFADSGHKFTPSTGYSVRIQGGSTQFRKRINNNIERLQMERAARRRHHFQDNEPIQVTLYVDRKEGLFSIYLNGEAASSASDPEPLQDGNWWHLSTLHDGREQVISNFTIRPWNGQLPLENNDLIREELPIAGEQIELHNGDTIVGDAISIEEGKLRINTEYVPISVPIERIRYFQVTAEDEREEPRAYSEDIRAHFHHGGHVTLQLKEITNETITGYSQVFGEATFDLDAFTQIDFNVYDLDFRERRGLPF